MRDEERCSVARDVGMDEVEALLLEADVADAEHFVYNEQVRVGVRGHGEAEPSVHARGIAFHGRINELLELGEFYDAVEAALDLLAAQSQDGAVQVDVIPAGQIRMKAGAELDQGRHPSLDSNMTAGRL